MALNDQKPGDKNNPSSHFQLFFIYCYFSEFQVISVIVVIVNTYICVLDILVLVQLICKNLVIFS